MGTDAVDDVEHHTHQDDSHADGHSHHEHRVQPADKGKVHHGFLGPEPDSFDYILKPEDTAKQETEYSGKHTAAGYDACQPHLLETVQQVSTDKQAQALSRVPEHEAEQDGIGNADQDGGVQLIIGGKPIHLHIHLKRSEQAWILHLGGRIAHDIIMVILNNTERVLIPFNLLLERRRVLLGHPPAQDIEIMAVMLGDRCHLAHIKISGKCPHRGIGRHQFVLPVADGLHNLLVNGVNLLLEGADAVIQYMTGLHRRPLIFIRKITALKMHGCIDGVYLIRQLFRHKIYHPHILVIFLTLKHHRVNAVIHIGVKLFIILPGNTAEPELHEPESKYLLHIIIKPVKRSHLVLGCLQLIPLLHKTALFIGQLLKFTVQRMDQVHRVLQLKLPVRVSGQQLMVAFHQLPCLCKLLLIRIGLNIGPQVLNRLEFRQGVFQVDLISGQIGTHHPVNVRLGTGNTQEFHFLNHVLTPFSQFAARPYRIFSMVLMICAISLSLK